MARRTAPSQDSRDLLSVDNDGLRPLAERMRPRSVDEMVGQRRLLAPGSALRRAVESGRVHSMILWGPPGCGKTTLALLLARYADAEFKAISAVLSGLPEVRQVLAEAAHRFAADRAEGRKRRRDAEALDAVAAAVIVERWLAAPDDAT
ncbi:AAA family ATPase, partial [Lysobacter sp. 2RAB21]